MIHIEHDRKVLTYPSTTPFHPNELYPEYPWGAEYLSSEKNGVYAMVRNLLHRMGLDREHFGTSGWNPLGAFITPGMTVLLKPNMVLHFNAADNSPNLDCVITHPSLVRAVLDYVRIALQGRGTIIVGDAPLQSCDYARLCALSGHDAVRDFFRDRGAPVEYVDFRQVRSAYNAYGILETVGGPGDPRGYTVVAMHEYSALKDKRSMIKNFRVTNYDHRVMRRYHTEDNNRFLVSGSVLAADVIIDMPKVKTHKKAGMTASLKNFIGIIGHKDCLPHHTKGSTQEGGDEYLKSSPWKSHAVFCEEWHNIFALGNQTKCARFMRKIAGACWSRAALSSSDPYREGSWYGNDTIWRTTLDLARIAHFADKEGVLLPTRQRTVFALADAIIAGEKNGPLHPVAKQCSLIAAGFDLPALDLALASLMGFAPEKIPTVIRAFDAHPLALTELTPDTVVISSNVPQWHNAKAKNLALEQTLRLVPPETWQGHIEKGN
ncbi:MAG: DUF362 domain-containing protein [Desulfovibrio sp.]|jgi:uncharacterized protein (DUF362 family)|nr:DUF362 domain-containing protein [Desulfovibrio sp.]